MPRVKHEQDPQVILANYQKDIARWKERKASFKDIQSIEVRDVFYMRYVLHPTSKQASKDITKALIVYLCDQQICTAQDIYRDLGYSDKPILKRLRTFQELGLVRRESKKWYMPSPRMLELRKKYLRHVCR